MNNPIRIRSKTPEIDRYVGARLRERRIMLGMTQHQLGEQVSRTFQALTKYEQGIDRISASLLYQFAEALGVEVPYFFDGIENGVSTKLSKNRRMLLGLTRNFVGIPPQRHKEALLAVTRALSDA